MPRSGTKLLRDLLNQNPKLGIPIAESNFIPSMIERYGSPAPFENKEIFREFYAGYIRTSFFWWMKKFGYHMSEEYLEKEADLKSWSSIFETIIKYHVPEGRIDGFIWGDKTPSYLWHMPVIKDIYPQAKFLHIIRDPRDYSLSRKKAWGTHLYSSAEMWRDGIEVARSDGKKLGEDYKEIYYEDLLDNPEDVLNGICTFLNCAFIPDMMELGRACENLGDAKGLKKILQNNQKKYVKQLSKKQVKRIEEIVFPLMIHTCYKIEYAKKYKPISKTTLKLLGRINKYKRILFDIRDKGLSEGIRYHFGMKKLRHE